MNWLSVLWRGLLIGVADIIPGVSGGTIALLTGIYERFINALRQLTRIPKITWDVLRRKTTLREAYDALDWVFLLPLLLGIAFALLIASRIIPVLMVNYPAATYSFFITLILAASIGLLREETHRLSSILALIGGLLLGVAFALLAPSDVSHAPLQLLIAGALAISAMLLPGISGSAVLLILGQYAFILEALHAPLANTTALLSFIAGILLGVVVITRILGKLLEKSRLHTLSALTGLMLGALLVPIQTVLVEIPGSFVSAAVFAILGLGAGALLLLSGSRSSSESTLAR